MLMKRLWCLVAFVLNTRDGDYCNELQYKLNHKLATKAGWCDIFFIYHLHLQFEFIFHLSVACSMVLKVNFHWSKRQKQLVYLLVIEDELPITSINLAEFNKAGH